MQKLNKLKNYSLSLACDATHPPLFGEVQCTSYCKKTKVAHYAAQVYNKDEGEFVNVTVLVWDEGDGEVRAEYS